MWLKKLNYISAPCSSTGDVETYDLTTHQRTVASPPISNIYSKNDPTLTTINHNNEIKAIINSHFYKINDIEKIKPIGLLASSAIANLKSKSKSGFKIVPLFSDVTLLHNTALLTEISTSDYPMKDNPMIAINRLYLHAFNLLTKGKSITETYTELVQYFGKVIDENNLLSFVYNLEHMGFLEKNLSPHLTKKDQSSFKKDKSWDLNISTIQNLLTYTELPLYTLIELTYDCNLDCKICYTNQFIKQNNKLSDEDYLNKILKPIIKSGISYVTIIGGEPFLKQNLLHKVIIKLRENNIFVKIITNGTLIDQKEAFILANIGVNKIEVSFDAFSMDKDNRIRTPKESSSSSNIHHLSLKAIKYLKKANIPQIGISVTVNAINYENIINNIDTFLKKSYINKIYFSIYYSDNPTEKALEITLDQIKYLQNKCHEWTNKFSSEIFDFESVILGSDSGWRCTCGRSSIVVDPFGRLRPCPFTVNKTESINHLDQNSFKSIWTHSDLLWKIRLLPKDICSTRLLRDTGSYAFQQNGIF